MRVVVESEVRPPGQALAEEEAILGHVARKEFPPTLRIWRNDRCVVIGRSQSPEAEANIDLCQSLEVPVLQRCSGGGAVYHHPGNLNFSLFLPLERRWMDVRRSQALFGGRLAAVLRQRLGLPAAHREGGVYVGGHKVSGSAQLRRRAFLHHGTLVLWEDALDMRDLLLAMRPGYVPGPVPSRPAPVAALSSLAGRKLELEEGVDLVLEAYGDPAARPTGGTTGVRSFVQSPHGPAPY